MLLVEVKRKLAMVMYNVKMIRLKRKYLTPLGSQLAKFSSHLLSICVVLKIFLEDIKLYWPSL